MHFIPIIPEQQKHLKELNVSNPHLDNLSLMWVVPSTFDFMALKGSVNCLHHSYDALRLRFVYALSGWRQFVDDEGEGAVNCVDLSALAELEQRKTLELEATRWQSSLNVFEGPLFRVVYFDFGMVRPGRLLFIFHHLIVDAFSIEILLRNLMIAYEQLRQGKKAHIPEATTSFATWTYRLKELARSVALQKELESYWLALPWDKVVSLPVDYSDGGWTTNTRASARTFSMSLSGKETLALLNMVDASTQVLDILLTALALTITQWNGSSVLYALSIDHGRMIFEDMDVSETVGLLASSRYMFLDLSDVDTAQNVLYKVKTQIRQIPGRGIRYGLLKYLNEDEQIVKKLRRIPRSEIVLNYFGRRRKSSFPFQKAEENQGQTLDAQNMRPQIIALEAIIEDGQLYMRWLYSVNIHHSNTIEYLAQKYIKILCKVIYQV